MAENQESERSVLDYMQNVYLSPAETQGDLTVKIAAVGSREFPVWGDKDATQHLLVIKTADGNYWKPCKTARIQLVKKFKTDKPARWVGKSVTIYPTRKVGSRTVKEPTFLVRS